MYHLLCNLQWIGRQPMHPVFPMLHSRGQFFSKNGLKVYMLHGPGRMWKEVDMSDRTY